MIKMPPTTGSAIAMASFHPCKPPDEGEVLETGEGPDIRVSLKIDAASGKKAAPRAGGCRHATWSDWSTESSD